MLKRPYCLALSAYHQQEVGSIIGTLTAALAGPSLFGNEPAKEAIALLEDALRRSRETHGPDKEVTLGIMNVLGSAYQRADRAPKPCRCTRR